MSAEITNAEARRMIGARHPKAPAEFLIAYELREGRVLRSRYLYDEGEETFKTEEAAWAFAVQFAGVAPLLYVNIYVVDGITLVPVLSYDARRLNRYPVRGVA